MGSSRAWVLWTAQKRYALSKKRDEQLLFGLLSNMCQGMTRHDEQPLFDMCQGMSWQHLDQLMGARKV